MHTSNDFLQLVSHHKETCLLIEKRSTAQGFMKRFLKIEVPPKWRVPFNGSLHHSDQAKPSEARTKEPKSRPTRFQTKATAPKPGAGLSVSSPWASPFVAGCRGAQGADRGDGGEGAQGHTDGAASDEARQ